MNNRRIHPLAQLICLACCLSILVSGCGGRPSPVTPAQVATLEPAPAAGSIWPTQGWRTSSPEEQGVDHGMLAAMLAEVEQKKLNLQSLLVIRNGTLVSETYFGTSQEVRHQLYSVTKSFVSTLIGIAMDQGKIDRLDRQIGDFFPEYAFANLDSQKQAMTLEDVLTMRTGLDWQEGDPAYMALYQSRDWVQFMLDKPMAGPPGDQFNYCSGCSHLLSAIVKKTTGMNTFDFAKKYLFKPLGITNVRWESDAKGTSIGGWGLELTPRDMAKLGYLFLRKGQWEGRQIVSAGWVEAATQKHTGTDNPRGYGYQWWTHPTLAAYMALGRYGQTIFVMPELDLIVVTTAEMDNHDEIFRLIEEYIVPAAQGG